MTAQPDSKTPLAYLIKGDDDALKSEALSNLLTEIVDRHAPGARHDAFVEDMTPEADDPDKDKRVADIVFACQTPTFLTPVRVVLVRDVGRLSTDQVTPLIEYLAQPLDTTIVVLVAGQGATSVKLANAVKKVGHVIDASAPEGKGRKGWLIERLSSSGLTFDAQAGQMLADHLGEDIGRIGRLLEALESAYGDGAKIDVGRVEPFLGTAGGIAPWDLTDAIDRGDIENALLELHRMLEGGGRHPLVVMVTLVGHFTNMLKLDSPDIRSESQAAEVLGIHPFRAKKAMTQLAKIGPQAVADAVVLLAQADLDLRGASSLKTEGVDDGVVVLEILVARLCRLSRAAGRRR